MKRMTPAITALLLLTFAASASAQSSGAGGERASSFDDAARQAQQKLDAALDELDELRDRIAEEQLPLSRELSRLEQTLTEKRETFQQKSRLLDSRTLDLSNLRNEIEAREQEVGYLSNLLSEYVRNFETRLHIAEVQRYREPLETARTAPDNPALSDKEVYQRQAALVRVAIDRLTEATGGVRFEGEAVAAGGGVKPGRFVLVGPYAVFRSEDGRSVGTAEERLGSLEPNVISFEDPATTAAAGELVARGEGALPFDPTLGNAHKIEATEDTLVEHVQKGGPVMIPILGLAAASLLVALYKWVRLALVRTPSRKQISGLLDAVGKRDKAAAGKQAKKINGPVGEMLQTGVDHMKEPRELIEEVMYEKVLNTRLKLQKALPFIAITAAAAPLLGLLGTVTGIINTFQLITVFGTGDVKTLSGGISEALITTKFGLIVAVPSLLLHAFLARKARGVVDDMEKSAVALVNAVMKSRERPEKKAA